MSWSAPFVRYDNFFSNKPDLTPASLSDILTQHPEPICAAQTCAGKECLFKKSRGSWSPVTLLEGTTRANANVVSVNYFVADLDHITAERLADVLRSIEGYAAILYSTHNHTPPANGSYRLVMPLSRPAAPAEWSLVRAAIITALGIPADPATKDLSRLYALPDAREGIPPDVRVSDGEALSVDEALQIAGVKSPAPAPLNAPPLTPVVYDIATLRARLSEARRSKASSVDPKKKEQATILGHILDGEPLARVGERDHTILRAVGLLAYWLPAGCPWELVKELLRPSLSAMLDAEPDERGLEYMFGVAEAKYAKQAASRAAADAKRAEEDAKLEAFKSRMVGKTIKAIGEEADVDLADGWEGVLLAGKSGPKVCEFNVDLILTCAPEFRDALTWNEFAKTVEVRGGDLDGIAANSLDGRAAGLIQSKYGCMAGEYLVGRSLLRVARENPYDPISEYLGEIAWDGTTRLDTFFEKYLGVDISDPDSARYVRAVSRRWLISLIARALRPGCKVDTVLILEGVQGAGKSTALEELVGSDYFLDTALEIGNKDTLQAIAGAWLIELGELASFRKAESNRIRQFITSKVDKFRPPFGRLVEPSPRRCVLVGTTNDKEYLSDRTGNRRYWPVRVGAIDVEGVRRDRDLILAEAVVAFRVGERWWLTEEEERSAQAETEARVNESTAEEAIERWWYGEPPAKRPAKAMLLDVAEMALKLSVDRVDHRIRMEIGYALHRLGFTRKGRERYYEPTEEMLTAPQRTTAARASTLALVTAMKAKGDIK